MSIFYISIMILWVLGAIFLFIAPEWASMFWAMPAGAGMGIAIFEIFMRG